MLKPGTIKESMWALDSPVVPEEPVVPVEPVRPVAPVKPVDPVYPVMPVTQQRLSGLLQRAIGSHMACAPAGPSPGLARYVSPSESLSQSLVCFTALEW